MGLYTSISTKREDLSLKSLPTVITTKAKNSRLVKGSRLPLIPSLKKFPEHPLSLPAPAVARTDVNLCLCVAHASPGRYHEHTESSRSDHHLGGRCYEKESREGQEWKS